MAPSELSRRDFLRRSGQGAVAAAAAMVACGVTDAPVQQGGRRLTARPGAPTRLPQTGESSLGFADGRDGLLFVPTDYAPGRPLPLLTILHGAYLDAESARSFGEAADALDAVVLIPESRGATWDLFRGGFGPDVQFLDAALAHTFDRCAIDPARVALAGFSDGASYALSLGVSNGDLFTHLIAFSPGLLDPGPPTVGRPRVFVSHGRNDPILSVTGSRDHIVPELRDAGYDVTYHEFDGGHTVPNEVALAALTWFLPELEADLMTWFDPAPEGYGFSLTSGGSG